MNKPDWKSLFSWRPWVLPWALLAYAGFLALVAGALILFTGAMLHHAITPDFPWLLAAGNLMLETQQIPQTDVFSWTMAGQPWVLYQWLFEVILALKIKFFGVPELVRSFALIAIGIYVMIPVLKDARSGVPLGYTLLVSCLALMTTAINLSLRPMLVTLYFLALQYGLIQGLRHQRISLHWCTILMGLIYLLWGNMHTGVVIGLLSLGLFLLGDWLESRRMYTYAPEEPGFDHPLLSLRTYGILGLAALGASLINPYGVGIYTYLSTLSGQTYLNESIQELQSPDFHQVGYQCFLVLLMLFFTVLPRLRKALPASAWLHLVVFTLAMLFVQRFVVWTALFYAWMLPQGLYLAWRHALPQEIQRWWHSLSALRPLVVEMMIITGLLFWWTPDILKAPPVRMGSCQSLEKGFAAYQALKQPTDKIFHDAEIGSCMLLYYPQQKVYLDTRFDFYGPRLMQSTRETVNLQRDPETMLKQNVNILILKQSLPLVSYLRSDTRYNILFEDPAMVIFRRTTRKDK